MVRPVLSSQHQSPKRASQGHTPSAKKLNRKPANMPYVELTHNSDGQISKAHFYNTEMKRIKFVNDLQFVQRGKDPIPFIGADRTVIDACEDFYAEVNHEGQITKVVGIARRYLGGSPEQFGSPGKIVRRSKTILAAIPPSDGSPRTYARKNRSKMFHMPRNAIRLIIAENY